MIYFIQVSSDESIVSLGSIIAFENAYLKITACPSLKLKIKQSSIFARKICMFIPNQLHLKWIRAKKAMVGCVNISLTHLENAAAAWCRTRVAGDVTTPNVSSLAGVCVGRGIAGLRRRINIREGVSDSIDGSVTGTFLNFS